MKGQFFLIGAVLICVLLYAGTAPLSALYSEPTGDMQVLSENLGYEMPHALNIGAKASSAAGTLISFSNFTRDSAASRGIDAEIVFVVFESSPAGIAVSAGNAAGGSTSVGINVSGTYESLTVAAGELNATQFSSGGETFSACVTTDAGTRCAEMLSNKTSLYSEISLSRGGAVLTKEILA